MIERDKVNVILGPLAAFELLAITDYVRDNATPLISLAAAEDVTQRKANPFVIRAVGDLGTMQPRHGRLRRQGAQVQARRHHLRRLRLRPRADVGVPARVRGCRRQGRQEAVAAAGDAGLHALHRPDRQCRRRVPWLRRLQSRQVHARLCRPRPQGQDPAAGRLDRRWTMRCSRSLGDEAVGVVSAAYYSADFGSDSNKRFVAAMQKDYGVLPGGYSAGMYVAGQCVEAAIQQLGGQADDRKALAEALHKVSLADTPRGAVKFDQYGNVVGEVFIRRCEKKGDQLVNTVIKTYPEREPVLDLPREGFPGEPGLHARLSAGQEPGELRPSRHPGRRRSCGGYPVATSVDRDPVRSLRRSIEMPRRARTSDAPRDARESDRHEPVADFGGEQHRARRPAVPAVLRLLPHLRPDAHPQPDARLLLHAGRLLRRHAALARRQLLAGGARQRRGHGRDRRTDRALPAAAPRRRSAAAGAADARASPSSSATSA